MKVLVCGSRTFTNYERMKETLNAYNITEIIHGGARGADTLAGRYGNEVSIPMQVFLAEWNTHGRSAGPIRNRRMLTEGDLEMVIAFWDGKSRGTQNMIDQAKKAGVPVHEVTI